MRLDKLLAHSGFGTRSEIKEHVRRGGIRVNGQVVKDSGMKVNPEADRIEANGKIVRFREFVYLMLNKPPGVLSATEDHRDRTVIDLLADEYLHYDLFPVGRLDKDTEGLLLLTNDGKLAHNLLSPRKHVPKTYYARVQGEVNQEDILLFAEGVTLEDGYRTMAAELRVRNLEVDDMGNSVTHIELTIKEGKFHQVKRMFLAVGKSVIYLQRLRMGPLALDETLQLGMYRELTDYEIKALRKGD